MASGTKISGGVPKKPSRIKNIGLVYLYFLAAAVLLSGIAATVYVFFAVKDSSERSLLTRTDTVAQLIDVDAVKALSGSEADLSDPGYLELKEKLQKTLAVNPDIKFIYLTGMKGGQVFFFVDSESPDSQDYSPPGQTYPEVSEKFLGVFSSKRSAVEGISTDRWGTWLSALTPIIDPRSGEVAAVAGMDISASSYIKGLIVYSSSPALATLFFLIVIGIYCSKRRKEMGQLTVKAELVSMAAHEIRSPLTSITWGIDGLLEDLAGKIPQTDTETLQMIKTSCYNLLKTVNDFLDLYSLDNSKIKVEFKNIELISVFREIVENSKLSAMQKGINVEIRSDKESVIISGDRDKLKRMFANLLSNAIKYSNQNSAVILSCKEKESSYVFTVSDSGIGVPVQDQKKIFKGFYRAENARRSLSQGTGLGLYHAKQVVGLHRGKIWLESEEGKGSTFFVELDKPAQA
jgi:signal transduction histidine kinase